MGEPQTRTPGDLTISAIDAASPAAMGPARLRGWMRQARSRLTTRWPALRYAVVRQYDTADCGAAALLTVLRFHGGDASFPYVRDLTQTDAQGATMRAMVTAAGRLGFQAKGVAGTFRKLTRWVDSRE